MAGDIEQLKKQLGELAEIVNAFKSEAVQLRIVDTILPSVLRDAPLPKPAPKDEPADKPPRRRPRSKEGKNPTDPATSGGRSRSGKKGGPRKAVEDLIAAGYFSQHRLIGEVVKYLAEKKATTVTQGALQMALNRSVQNGEMSRERNASTSQFEYWK